MGKRLTRSEKEELYKVKMTELQRRWGNPLDDEWDFSDWTDEELDRGLEDTIGQLRFEKGISSMKKLFLHPLYLLVILGMIGLIVFGIRQLI